MTTIISLITIIQSFTIALGVGASTLAILNFFAAIKDGIIDDTERRMMGVVYVVLRVAMVFIFVTTITIFLSQFLSEGLLGLSAFMLAQFLTLVILFINAMLMTAHLMPSTFGPALQAGSWYTLGFLSALNVVGWTEFSFGLFMMGYITWLILAVGIVNGVMAILKSLKN